MFLESRELSLDCDRVQLLQQEAQLFIEKSQENQVISFIIRNFSNAKEKFNKTGETLEFYLQRFSR